MRIQGFDPLGSQLDRDIINITTTKRYLRSGSRIVQIFLESALSRHSGKSFNWLCTLLSVPGGLLPAHCAQRVTTEPAPIPRR